MKIIKSITQSEVFSHWERIVFPLVVYADLAWSLTEIESASRKVDRLTQSILAKAFKGELIN